MPRPYIVPLRCSCGAPFQTWDALARHYRRDHRTLNGFEFVKGRDR